MGGGCVDIHVVSHEPIEVWRASRGDEGLQIE